MADEIMTLGLPCPICKQRVTSIGITPHTSDTTSIWVGFRHGKPKDQCQVVIDIRVLSELMNPANMP